jgi:hypothetical protein
MVKAALGEARPGASSDLNFIRQNFHVGFPALAYLIFVVHCGPILLPNDQLFWYDLLSMRYLWILLILVGIWFLASAAVQTGLLPSGHGSGRLSETLIGIALVVYPIYRLTKRPR